MYCENKCNNLHGCRKRGFPLNNCIGCYCNIEHFISPTCDVYPANEHISCGTKNFFKSKWKTSYLKHTNVTRSCFYLIKSSNGKKVAVTIKSLILQPQCICHKCGLIIFYRSDWSILPLRLCGNQSNVKIPPLNKEVYIIFDDFGLPNSFSITYRNA
uniref:CUB domain-containing protein n=1 Tax=Strongyloides papillosus TaxID=174720 RepID=A0A0N5CFV4_STREA